MPLVTGPGNMQGVEIPDMVGNYGRLMALQQMQQNAPLQHQLMQQQVEAGQVENQQRQIALKDQQAMNAAMQQWSQPKQPAAQAAPQGASAAPVQAQPEPAAQPDYDNLIDLARKNGASFSAIQGLQKSVLDMKDKAATIAKDSAQTGQGNASAMKTKNGMIIDAMSGVMQLPDDQLAPALLSSAQELAAKGLLDPQHVQMAQQLAQSGDPATIRNQLTRQIAGMGGFNKLLDDAQKQLEIKQKQQEAAFGPVGQAADAKYSFLQKKLAAQQPITADDQAWMKGHEKQKMLVPTAKFELKQGAAMPAAGGGSAVGEDFLATLPQGLQAQVKAMANGDIAIPPAGTRNPQAQQLRTAVLTYDPTYTDARYKGKQNFKTSGDAQNIVQLATAMEHADRATSNSAKVGWAPALGNKTIESPESAAYMQDAEFLTGEVGKLVKNGVLTVDESNKISSGLTSARQSVRDAALTETMDLLGGKSRGLFQKYKTATGQDIPLNEFFDGRTQQRLTKYGIVEGAATPQGSTGGGPTPQTHTFSLSAWQSANPKGDPNAAKAAAQKQGYQVVP